MLLSLVSGDKLTTSKHVQLGVGIGHFNAVAKKTRGFLALSIPLLVKFLLRW